MLTPHDKVSNDILAPYADRPDLLPRSFPSASLVVICQAGEENRREGDSRA